ncbi:hypothetical protein ACFSB1_12180 [Halopseudomonas phragmitis]|uniref:Uncharacterized protein n=1 Tax=Halopseudomonas phragmitis TaxID=1931241 RepID=A0A1V0B0F0_9GAMM|nr:hypothetical protein [Halopseudomonas phragmitis]AQZ93416.1 hypothetical protein BVH74_00925 [Halopseudomonas phragmitis]
MTVFEDDIERWIKENYADVMRAKQALEPVLTIETAISISRILRSVLYLSERDYDALAVYAKKAVDDPRNVLWWAEYDNRNIQKRDFNNSLYSQGNGL